MVLRHESPLGFNHHEFGFKMTNNSSKGTGDVKNLILNDKSASCSVMENAQLLSAERMSPELPEREEIGVGKYVQSDKRVCQISPATLELLRTSQGPSGLFRKEQNREGSSVKQEKEDYCSPDLSSAMGYNMPRSKCSVSAHVKRANWDLNIAMDTRDSSLDGSVMKHGQHDGLDLGGMQKERIESCPVQILTREFKGTDVKLGKSILHESEFNLRLSNLSMPLDSDVGLDLQLKPPCRPEIRFDWGDTGSSEEPNSIREMTELSLSLAGNLEVVKSELNEEGCQMDIKKVVLNTLKSADLKHTNSEPCETAFQEAASKTAGSSNLKSSDTGEESEPHEGPSQEQLKSPEGKSLQMKLDNGSMISYSAVLPKGTSERMVLDLNSEPMGYDVRMLHDGPEMHIDAILHMDTGKIAGESEDIVSQALVHAGNNSQHSGEDIVSQALVHAGNNSQHSREMLSGPFTPQEASGVINETSCGLAPDLPPGCVISNGNEPIVSDGTAEVIAQTCFSGRGDSNISKSVPEELHVDSYGISKAGESDGEEIDMSIDTLEQETYDDRNELDNSHDVVSSRDMALEERGVDDDGKVRDMTGLQGAIEGPVEQREEKEVHNKERASALGPADVPIRMPSHEEIKEMQIQSSYDLKKGLASVGFGGQFYIDSDPGISMSSNMCEPSAARVPTAGFSENRHVKTTLKTKRNHIFEKSKGNYSVNDKGSGRNSKFRKRDDGRTIPEGSQGELGRRQENAIESDLLPVKHTVLSNMGSASIGHAIKYESGRGKHSYINNLNSAPNRLWSGSKKGAPARPMASHDERNRSDGSFRRQKPYHAGRRDESCNNRFWKSKYGRSQGKPVGERGSDLTTLRWAENRFGALQCDPNSDHNYVSELLDNSTGFRFLRLECTAEVAFPVAWDDQFETAGMVKREPMMDERHLSQFPSTRWTPGAREGKIAAGVQIADNSTRNISPSRCTGRDIADFRLTHEEKLTRDFPGIAVDPFMLSQTRPQYEHAENTTIQRERRILSPIQRRGPPSHLADVGVKSSRRSRTRSPHQRLPPRRSPDAFDGHPENCRSDSMRSPLQRPCFAGDAMVRRRGSLPSMSRLSDDVRDIGPLSEHGFWRPGRDLPRNIRPAEEEHFGPMNDDYFCELAVGAEYADSRRGGERHRLVRPFKQHPNDGCNGGNFSYRAEDAPFIRFCPEVIEEFPDRGSSRNLDGCIKNRPGNSPGRPRGMEEQEENYRYRRGMGWHNSNSSSDRRKRRRFDPAKV